MRRTARGPIASAAHRPDQHRPDEHRPDEHRPDDRGSVLPLVIGVVASASGPAAALGLPENWRLHREQKSGRVHYALWQRGA